ncbi:MAG TPA: hypothetical protein PK791_01450, partial [Anaerolineaceae bacterium]|nr:hypothetical protein [Anaerolineaceae bacterium]
ASQIVLSRDEKGRFCTFVFKEKFYLLLCLQDFLIMPLPPVKPPKKQENLCKINIHPRETAKLRARFRQC